MDKTLLYKLFEPFSASEGVCKDVGGITKTDLYSDGLSGSSNSKEKRAELARALSLPDDMTANALLEAMNLLISKEEYTDLVKRLSLGKNDN
jgi:ribonuclease M5